MPGRPLVLETLHALMSNTKVVKEAMAKGKIHFPHFDISYKLKPTCLDDETEEFF